MNLRESLSGTRMSTKGMQTMSSSGIDSIDFFIGGGLPLNSITLLEEDEHKQYSSMIAKSFISEGIDCNHNVIISSPTISSINSRFLRELPSRSQYKNEELTNDTDMKIAWRYKSLPSAKSDISSQQFDFSAHISKDKLESSNIQFSTHKNCTNFLKSQNACESTVTRVLIHDLCSPLSPLSHSSLPNFIFELKSLSRKLSNVLFLVIMSSNLLLASEESYVRSRLHYMVDCVINLVSFDDLSQTPYTEYNGLFNILKLPKVNSLNYYFIPETFDLGFQLKKNARFFVVDKLCLPPDLSENVSRTTSCSTVNKTIDF